MSATDVDTGWQCAANGLRELVQADEAFALIAARRDDVPRVGSFAGWAIVKVSSAPDVPAWNANAERFRRTDAEGDSTIIRIARDHGSHRAYLRRELGTPEELDVAPSTRMMRQLGVRDRLVCAHSLAQDLEVFFGFNRTSRDNPFLAADRDFLIEAMPAIGRICRWWALSHGAFPGQKLLSARERQALAYLLGPQPAKHIATEMGLSDGSLSQLALRLYAKLGVTCRTELMALWLHQASPGATASE